MRLLGALLPLHLVNLEQRTFAIVLGSRTTLHPGAIPSTLIPGKGRLSGGRSYQLTMARAGARQRRLRIPSNRTKYATRMRTCLPSSHRVASTSSREPEIPPTSLRAQSQRQGGEEERIGRDHKSLMRLTVLQLKERLRSLGQRTSGPKRELVDRLHSVLQEVSVEPRKSQGTEVGKSSTVRKSTPSREVIHRQPTPRSQPLDPTVPQLRVLSWNVNGLRALLKKEEGREALAALVTREEPHVLGLQETKIQEHHVPGLSEELAELLPDYKTFCKRFPLLITVLRHRSTRTFCAINPCPELLQVTRGIGQAEGDAEGRVITAELDGVYVVNVYTPNSGDGLRRLSFRTQQWDHAFAAYVDRLQRTKPVVVIGDLNVAHEETDFFNPQDSKTRKQAGTTLEERTSFSENLLGRHGQVPCQDRPIPERHRSPPPPPPPPPDNFNSNSNSSSSTGPQLVDTFRKTYPGAKGIYSYWSMRAGNRPYNRGMRLDMCLASRALTDGGNEGSIHDAFVLDTDTIGVSDHCPIGLILRISKYSNLSTE